MRGVDAMQEGLFTVAKLGDFVPADHPLRSIRVLVNDALAATRSSSLRRCDARLKGRTAMPKLAANLTMLFNEVDFLDRFAVAAKADARAACVAVSAIVVTRHPRS